MRYCDGTPACFLTWLACSRRAHLLPRSAHSGHKGLVGQQDYVPGGRCSGRCVQCCDTDPFSTPKFCTTLKRHGSVRLRVQRFECCPCMLMSTKAGNSYYIMKIQSPRVPCFVAAKREPLMSLPHDPSEVYVHKTKKRYVSPLAVVYSMQHIFLHLAGLAVPHAVCIKAS